MLAKLEQPTKADVLITEMNHRWCNALQVISSSLYICGREPRESLRAKRVLADLHDQVQAMAALHRRLSQTPSGDETFESYCGGLCLDLVLSFGRTDVVPLMNIVEPKPDARFRHLVALLITELMTNALKHGRPTSDEGVVHFLLRPYGLAHLELSVIDNFAPPTTLPPPPAVVNALVHDLDGQLMVDLTPGYRTRIILPHD